MVLCLILGKFLLSSLIKIQIITFVEKGTSGPLVSLRKRQEGYLSRPLAPSLVSLIMYSFHPMRNSHVYIILSVEITDIRSNDLGTQTSLSIKNFKPRLKLVLLS